MIKVKNDGLLMRAARSVLIRSINYLENNNNTNSKKNGENKLLNVCIANFNERKQHSIIFDVGANVGAYSSYVLSEVLTSGGTCTLYAFEPLSTSYKMLQNTVLSGPEVVLNNFALSNNSGELVIYYDKDESTLASLYDRNLDYYSIGLTKTETIQAIRADDYIKEHNIQHIHFMKIDVEGHEISALTGFGEYLSGDFIDFIQFEYGGANLDSKTSLLDLYNLMTKKGFTICKVMRNSIVIRKYHPNMENYFYSNFVAVSNRILQEVS